MASAGSSTASEQLMKPHARHAFNYSLWGYDARIDKRVKGQVIKLNRIVATRDRDELVQEAHSATNGSPVRCTEEELKLDTDDESLLTAVVVGMRPSCSPKLGCGNAELFKVSEKGRSVQSLKGKNEVLKYDPTALRVVSLHFREDAVFYALTKRNQRTKLYDAVMISGDEVFIFPEFRNDTLTIRHGRIQASGEKIRAMMIGNTASKREVGDKILVSLEVNLKIDLASF
jgi:hypothetical protein